ncbi:MAG: glycosyltransferase [Bacteroidota bacterium]|nr:glycosyltransferase [Bacteroidota bacterium]
MQGLSILIASFGPPEEGLVDSLSDQAQRLDIPFEILVSDDQPSQGKEEEDPSWSIRTFYRQQPLGRSGNRNFLADQAKYQHLLFLDGDSKIGHSEFLSRYWIARDQAPVICGGTDYQTQPPSAERQLRWKYGKASEIRSAKERNQNPTAGFSSFNFLIRDDLFQRLGFDNSLNGYGHEDTLFGKTLKHHCIEVLHIDNPLIHMGLDTNVEFLEKSLHAVGNLWQLIQEGKVDEDITLYHWYSRLQKAHLLKAFAHIFRLFQKSWEKRILEEHSLRVLDLYKLGFLCVLASDQGSNKD